MALVSAAASAAASASLLFVGSTPASAEVQINYDLSASTVTTFGGLVELSPPPLGISRGSRGASASITIPGGIYDPQDGPAFVENFQLGEMPINENLFDVAYLLGSASAQQIGVAAGHLVNESSVIISPAQPFALETGGAVVCTPYEYCEPIGVFPVDLFGTQNLMPLAFELRDLDVYGESSIHGRLELILDGHTAIVDISGVESDRQPAPEPAAIAQMMAGCMGLSALSRSRRPRLA